MNIENIRVGDTYKNYRELCSALDITPTTGTAKMKQIKEMETLFRYSKNKYSFKIEEIYEKPIIQISTDNQNKTSYYHFSKHVQTILMQYLIYKNPTIKLQTCALYEKIGLLNSKFNSYEAKINFQKNNPDIDTDEIYVVKNMAFSKSYSIMVYALNRMEHLGFIKWNKEYIILTKDGTRHTAGMYEEIFIIEAQKKIFKEYGVKTMSELYMKGLTLGFYKQLNSELRETHDDWISVSHVISIEYQNTVTMLPVDTNILKQELNNDLISYLQKRIEKKHHYTTLDQKFLQPSQVLNKLTLDECKRKSNLIINEFVKNVV